MNKLTKIFFFNLLSFLFILLNAKNCGNSCNSGSNCCPELITKYENSCCNNSCSKNCEKCECRASAKTTFVYNPQFQVGSPEYLSGFRDRMDARKYGHGGVLQATFFGGKSTGSEKLAKYFTPFCKNKLLVKSGTPREIDPQHFNVALQNNPEKYESIITFCPHISTMGLGLVYRQNLNRLGDGYDQDERHWYFEISSPLTRIETSMGLSECISFTGDMQALVLPAIDQKFYSNMTQAFNQPAWCYGKINGCCEHAKTRLADITLMIAYEAIKCDSCIVDGYFGLLAPTGNKRCSTYVFEPIVGHAGHWGLVTGMHLNGSLWENKSGEIKLETTNDLNGMYLFKKDEIRSFDLKSKPWSRYMEIYKNQEQAQQAYDLGADLDTFEAAQNLSSPGINAFTQYLTVRPGLSLTTNTSFVLSSKKFKGEVGYNLYWKQSECVEICCWKEGPALKAFQGSGDTNPLRTISTQNTWFIENPSDPETEVNITNPITRYSNSIIKKCDLDMQSATHPGYLINTLYLTAGGHWDEIKCPLFFDLGGSYEFDDSNLTLNRWTIWAKSGISF